MKCALYYKMTVSKIETKIFLDIILNSSRSTSCAGSPDRKDTHVDEYNSESP